MFTFGQSFLVERVQEVGDVLVVDDPDSPEVLPRDDVTADKVEVVEAVGDEVVVVASEADVVKPVRDRLQDLLLSLPGRVFFARSCNGTNISGPR